MDIGSFVRMKRREMNLSQTELAERAGVGLNFVYQLEKNKPTVQLNCARQVLQALGFDIGVRSAGDLDRNVERDSTRQGAQTADRSYSLPWD
jgi:y4mF family transcriptional regulator